MSHAARGFSLLELLLVMAIAALMVALVPALLSGVGGSTELRGAVRQLAAGLRAARNEAVTRQHEAVLALDLAQRHFRVTGQPRPYRLPERVAIELFTAESERLDEAIGTIRFFPDGSSTGGRITLSGERVQYLVDVDWLTGRIQILDQTVQ